MHFLILNFSFESRVCHILKCSEKQNKTKQQTFAQMIYGLFFDSLAP